MLEFEPSFSENRRAHKRVRFTDSVHYEGAAPALEGGTVGYDISESGIRMRFSDYVPIGSEVTLTIRLDNDEVVEYTGRVMWVRNIPYTDHYQAGVHFESSENPVDSRAKIHHYIESF